MKTPLTRSCSRPILWLPVAILSIGCNPVGVYKSIDGRRVSIDYFDPAQRLYGPLSAAAVTVQPDNEPRSFDLDLQVNLSTGSSPVLLVFSETLRPEALAPILGDDGVNHLIRTLGQRESEYLPPVVEVFSEGAEAPLDREIYEVHFWEQSEVEQPLRQVLSRLAEPAAQGREATAPLTSFCLFGPGSSQALRFSQNIIPNPQTTEGRYNLRLNWIELNAGSGPASLVRVECSPSIDLDGVQYAVPVARRMNAFARELDVNVLGAVGLGAVLILGVFLIGGS